MLRPSLSLVIERLSLLNVVRDRGKKWNALFFFKKYLLLQANKLCICRCMSSCSSQWSRYRVKVKIPAKTVWFWLSLRGINGGGIVQWILWMVYWLEDSRFEPDRAKKKIVPSPKRPESPVVRPASYSVSTGNLFPRRQNDRDARLAIHVNPLPRLKISGVIPPLPLYAKYRIGKILPLFLPSKNLYRNFFFLRGRFVR